MNQKPVADTRYIHKDGTITDLLKSSCGIVLNEYIDTVLFWSKKRNKLSREYAIKESYIVGSILDGNDQSDLDIMFLAQKIDEEDYRFIKMVMAERFFNKRDKILAIDVFVRPYDAYPEKHSFDITDQMRSLLKPYNEALMFGSKF